MDNKLASHFNSNSAKSQAAEAAPAQSARLSAQVSAPRR